VENPRNGSGSSRASGARYSPTGSSTGAGFVIEEEAEGPRIDDEYAYHHVLARVEVAPNS
jgi:hypothetical protein